MCDDVGDTDEERSEADGEINGILFDDDDDAMFGESAERDIDESEIAVETP